MNEDPSMYEEKNKTIKLNWAYLQEEETIMNEHLK